MIGIRTSVLCTLWLSCMNAHCANHLTHQYINIRQFSKIIIVITVVVSMIIIFRNINLQNLRRASCFIDVMDRKVDRVQRWKQWKWLKWRLAHAKFMIRYLLMIHHCCRKPRTSLTTTETYSPRTRWSRTKASTKGVLIDCQWEFHVLIKIVTDKLVL